MSHGHSTNRGCGCTQICPNEGFWHQLCALEKPLGLAERSNVDAPPVVDESYGTATKFKIAED